MKKVISYLMIMVAFIFVSEAQARTLAIQDTSGAPGDVIRVDVVIDDAKDLLSADMTLTYDPGLLILKEVKKASLTSNFIIASQVGSGEIAVAIATAQALQGGSGSLVEVSFQIDDAAPLGTDTFISIPRATLYNGAYQSMETTLKEGKVTVPCYSISPTSNTIGPQGGSGSVNVTAGPNCSWTAFSIPGGGDWITITSGASGSGNGTVSYSVAANASTSPRTGAMNIAGATFTVTQGGSIFPIQLTSPSDQAFFDACSLYSLPTFAWSTTQTFKSYEIQFSTSDAFSLISLKVKTSAMRVQISSSTWKKILPIPGITGGSVYWRVVGSRADKTQATSSGSSILIEGAHEVDSPQISSTSKGPLPTLSWINHCNMKFKVWFGSDGQFSNKKSFSFSIKSLSETFTKGLTSSQWGSIKKLVGEVTGATIYWYVDSWDGLGRYAKTDVMSFALTD
jgi:hypothetical protein